MHLELQASHETVLADRLHWYNTLLKYRHQLPVKTVLLLLRRSADSPQLTGTLEVELPGEPPYLVFHYLAIRVWELPVEQLLTGGLGLLPLAPLANVPEEQVPHVLHRMEERMKEAGDLHQARILWSTSYILSGLRFSPDTLQSLFQGTRFMDIVRHSSVYEEILAEIAKGKAIGVAEGRAEEAHSVLLRIGSRRWGDPSPEHALRLQTITNLDRIERMIDHVLDAKSWDDLLGVS